MTLERRLILDGIDLYTAFRCYTAENGCKSFYQFPKAKNIATTDWHEIDGITADLSNPLPETRTVTLDIYAYDKTDTQTFAAWLATSSPYHTFKFRNDIISHPTTYTLRLASVSSVTVLADKMAKITLQLTEDDCSSWINASNYAEENFPAIATSSLLINNPYRKAYRQPEYKIDGIKFTDLGFNVIKGTDASIYKSAAVNDNLKTVLSSVGGTAYYDEHGDVRLKNRDITLKLVAHETTRQQKSGLWHLTHIMSILYGILARPGKRQLWFGKLQRTFDCYYKQASVTRLIILDSGEAWCEFSVTLATLQDTPQATHTIPYGRAYSDGYSPAYL